MRAILLRIRRGRPRMRAILLRIRRGRPPMRAILLRIRRGRLRMRAILLRIRRGRLPMRAILLRIRRGRPPMRAILLRIRRGRLPMRLRGDPSSPSFFRMKPGDHPEFFRSPAPEGRSRESTIVLTRTGDFTHEGEPVVHPGLARAMHTWITRHPDDGRFILSNGYDWTYFTVEDAPFFVRGVTADGDRLLLALSDGTVEPWVPADTRVGADGALYARVKRLAAGPALEAKFTRHAQAALEPFLVDLGGRPGVRVGGASTEIGGVSIVA